MSTSEKEPYRLLPQPAKCAPRWVIKGGPGAWVLVKMVGPDVTNPQVRRSSSLYPEDLIAFAQDKDMTPLTAPPDLCGGAA